ncbi:flavin prenyltransferase UbiX [Pleionea sp. CnH1-48]|uniref:flavin prenyltransferase UbiX n=1 Tax=Pleionea sp. CnH1-48 TaxID=2954494 RepID=UPI002096CCF9|nr:flavin prenyltransferase UbiX [Pleionea sp. CnH1-48]MCO7226422.1 UbiX family flavin prenyltransferase [Pleionea sp. CnH1-48]
MTGASGAVYGIELLRQLRCHYDTVYLLLSDAARVVFATEMDWSVPQNVKKATQFITEQTALGEGNLEIHSTQNWMSPTASGSSAPQQMIVCPCSTGTLSAIANGASDNLIERAADVVIKERGQLIMVPRETPFSTIHLRNMLSLSEMGVTIMPAAPGFYHKPQSIEDCVNFMVARIMDHLKLDHNLSQRWGYKASE